MGFLDGLKKMIQGKPVFEDPSAPQRGKPVTARDQLDSKVATPTTPPPARVLAPEQTKVIPTFDLRHCRTHLSGNTITVTIWVTNTSKVDIEIDKCVILNRTTEVDRRLSPGQAHEITLYKGAAPTTDNAHKANIFYKSVRENEYFRADFMVEYNYESNGIYTVEELHPEHYAIKEY